MPHFERIRVPGGWASPATITDDELEDLDQHQSEAINGDEGGVWAPSDVIEIGGAGLSITGDLVTSGTVSLEGGFEAFGDCSFEAGTVTFDNIAVVIDGGALNLNGGTVINVNASGKIEVETSGKIQVKSGGELEIGTGSTLVINSSLISGTCEGNLNWNGGTFRVTGGATLDVDGALTGTGTTGTIGFAAGASMTHAGTFTLTGTVSLEGSSQTLKKPLVCSTAAGSPGGTIAWRRTTTGDADASFNPGTWDEVKIQLSLTADRTITLTNTGATAGQRVRFTRGPTATAQTEKANVTYNGGASVIPVGGTGSEIDWVDLIYDGSAWQYSASGKCN